MIHIRRRFNDAYAAFQTILLTRYLRSFHVTAVRFGRVPKREKARILAAMQQSSHSRSQEKAVAAELEDEQRVLTTVVRAHLDTCDFTRDKVAPVLARARETPNYTACPPTLVSILYYICNIIIRRVKLCAPCRLKSRNSFQFLYS